MYFPYLPANISASHNINSVISRTIPCMHIPSYCILKYDHAIIITYSRTYYFIYFTVHTYMRSCASQHALNANIINTRIYISNSYISMDWSFDSLGYINITIQHLYITNSHIILINIPLTRHHAPK